MSKIKILSPQEICKIAAGEVVERPANIVKELVENALDAGASLIEIYLEKSGKSLIRILDNGCGMSSKDAIMCFAHHATSKISALSDLDNLSSFGFRGEALSSIAAVSKISLITMEKGSACGTQVNLVGGVLDSQLDIASPVGTDISISDLFYNTPARQKFLKKDETEWRQIILLFQAFVFDYQNVHFKLYHDNRLIYNCPVVQNLQERVLQIWDLNAANNMLKLNDVSDTSSIKVSGIVSNHQTFRYNRSNMFCFVNRRLVKNHGLIKAALKGYANVLPQGRYPIAILFIDLPSNLVDINVHPRKEEVSFLNPRVIENMITKSIKQVLEQKLSSYVSSSTGFENKFVGAQISNLSTNFDSGLFFSTAHDDHHDIDQKIEPFKKFNDYSLDLSPHRPGLEPMAYALPNRPTETLSKQSSFVERKYEIIGQFKQTYIIVSNDYGLVLIDQHAAHERVMYEKFKINFANVVTVNLMFPVIVSLSQLDLATLIPYLDLLKKHGIGADIFGQDQIIINSTPTYLKQVKLDELINQLICWLHEQQDFDTEQFGKKINEHLHAQMACKAAVKAGDILTCEQMYELLDYLEKAENRLTCPHGRPTIWSFGLDEIEKKFKRKL